MSTLTYNGWKNRSTWNVALWLGNDEGYYRETVAMAKRMSAANIHLSGLRARIFVTHTLGWDRTPDGDRMGSVDWPAIAECIREMAE